ncbi:hypothetical protein SLEP1_g30961 [Rubroshorea leprosula]|uniref:Uncharacterized protein n=1 Tax=Rubroshorea leprosula TaxID=152421 RepID=A0AAV5K1Y0_9ROSI|nr:hypothetical protein SLEP1_g30961 [Rubroshorea leprosula]
MKAKDAATKADTNLFKEELAQMVASMEDKKLELDLLKISVQQFADMLLVLEAVLDNLAQTILQL